MSKGNNSSKSNLDNHANQLNPQHSAYWSSRGVDAAQAPAPPPAAPAASSPGQPVAQPSSESK